MLLIYLVIFFAIAIALQASARKEHLGTFEKTRINVAVADRDQSELSRGLIRYLSTIHNVSEISSEPSVMQEELFYRNTSYIVQIPENFYQTCIEEEEPLSVTKVPGSYTSFYVDQQISTWINSIRTYTAAGFSLKEAMDADRVLNANLNNPNYPKEKALLDIQKQKARLKKLSSKDLSNLQLHLEDLERIEKSKQ